MRLLPLFIFGLAIPGSAVAQSLTDSFNYAAGTNLHNLAGSGGIDWKNHNLSGNNGASVTASGLSYTDAGYSTFISNGRAAEVTSAGAGSVNSAPTLHPSLLTVDGLRSTFGNVLYGSFLVKATAGQDIATAIYFDSGFPIGAGNRAFSAGLYVGSGQYRTMAFNESNGSYNDLPTGKTTAIGQTDLVVFRYEQRASTNEQIFSVAINPVFTGSGITWDQTSIGLKGPSNFRTEFWSYHYSPNPPGTVIYDEVKFGATLESVTPVPEPATMAALSLGLVALISRRKTAKR